MMRSLVVRIIAGIILCLAVGLFAGLATAQGVSTWYTTLQKPFFNPPNWLFGPVWTLLYIMMGIAAALVWHQQERTKVKPALKIFGVQLSLNFAWSFLFFAWQMPLLAFIEILVLWSFILLTIRYFYAVKPLAAYLLVPYLCWVSFASVLNFSIWYLN